MAILPDKKMTRPLNGTSNGGSKMTENISWDEATQNAGFVVIKPETEKVITLTNWRFEKKDMSSKIAPGEIEFVADCIEDDGEAVEKVFSTTSKRLKAKLRPIFEDKDNTESVKITILRVGEQFNTQYSVKEIENLVPE